MKQWGPSAGFQHRVLHGHGPEGGGVAAAESKQGLQPPPATQNC